MSCQGGGPAFSLSGWELASGTIVGGQKIPGESILFSIPFAAMLFVAFWLLAGARHGKGVMWLPIFKIVAAAVPLLILLLKYLNWTGEIRRQGAGLLALHFNGGYFLTILAFVTAGIGALLEIDRQRALTPTALLAAPLSAHSPAASQNFSEAPISRFCPRCGTKTTNGALFCVECGYHLA